MTQKCQKGDRELARYQNASKPSSLDIELPEIEATFRYVTLIVQYLPT